MKGVTREDRFRAYVALDMVQSQSTVDRAEQSALGKMEGDVDAFAMGKLLDPWREAKKGPLAAAEAYLTEVAGRLGVDVADGLEKVGDRLEGAVRDAPTIDSTGVWEPKPDKKGWPLLGRIFEALQRQSFKRQVLGAFDDAKTGVLQHLQDGQTIKRLMPKAAAGVPLTDEERTALFEIRDRKHADFAEAVEDPGKARRYGHNGIGEQKALAAIEDYRQIQFLLGEPISDAQVRELQQQVYVSVLTTFCDLADEALAKGEEKPGLAGERLREANNGIVDAMRGARRRGVSLPIGLLKRLAEFQSKSSPKVQKMRRLEDISRERFWLEQGKLRPRYDDPPPSEMSDQQLVSRTWGIGPWKILEQVEARGGIDNVDFDEAQLKQALTNTIAAYFDVQTSPTSLNTITRLFDQRNPFLADDIQGRLDRIEECMAIMEAHGITMQDLEKSDVRSIVTADEMIAEFDRVRNGLGPLRQAQHNAESC